MSIFHFGSLLQQRSVLKDIVKYQDHPSIKAIERVPKSKDLLNFSNEEKNEIFQKFDFLDASKACQDTHVPTKIIKENVDIFTGFAHPSINTFIINSDFPLFLELGKEILFLKKIKKIQKIIIDQ